MTGSAVSTEEPPEPATGKGRPTPKRRDAEQARKARAKPPRNRREAMQVQRARSKADRAKMQQAMSSGDDRYLPARDKGPQRRFIRDYIDSRRTLAEFLLPIFLVIFVLIMVPNPTVISAATMLWLIVMVITPIDLFMVNRRLKAELRTKFPNESYKGATTYALMRSTQIRKLRMPKPQVGLQKSQKAEKTR